jgi:hypothetical protein
MERSVASLVCDLKSNTPRTTLSVTTEGEMAAVRATGLEGSRREIIWLVEVEVALFIRKK